MFHKSKTVSTIVIIQQGGNLGSTFESMRICKDNLKQEIRLKCENLRGTT